MNQAIPDLSQYHHPLTSIFPRPSTPAEHQAYRLTDEQVRSFEEQGYVAGVRILTEDQVDVLCQQLAELMDPHHPGHRLFHEYHSNESLDPSRILFHALGAWRIVPAFHDLLWHPAWTVPASQLLGGAVRFWHDQLFCKPARDGGVVAWHQDYSYWTRTQPMAHLTCWIALDDATEENGCLRYIPGSHRWDLLPITGLAGDMDAIRGVLDERQLLAFARPISIALRRGEATFHHPLMVHGSAENRSDRPRRATVLNALRDGTRSMTDDPLLQGVPAIPVGDSVDGSFFPILWDPGETSTQTTWTAQGPSGRA